MKRIFVPARRPEDWQQLLADPELHWKTGKSARTLAYCWHATDEFPGEIRRVFAASPVAAFHSLKPLLILPEYKVSLRGRGGESQCDIFVLAKANNGELVTITVEGKVEEPFGEPLGKWKSKGEGFTDNKRVRLVDLQHQLGLTAIPDHIYYQLVHRTAAAVVEARRFNARHALMLIHSFSPTSSWFADYTRFLSLFAIEAHKDTLHHLRIVDGIAIFAGWVGGDPHFLTM